MKLTVLGCSGTHVGAQRMCSSYLVEHAGTAVAFDLGNGSLANLQQTIRVTDLDAVVLSHLHPDHFVDVYSLYYALRFQPDGAAAVPVHAPEGGRERIQRLLDDDPEFDRVCPVQVARPGDHRRIGTLDLRFFAAFHPVAANAVRVEADRRVLAYSGDSAATPALVECARDADLFIADATWLERDRPLPEGIHMTGAEAGRTAAAAGARRLLVTHVYPANDPAEVAAEAANEFDGEVLVAADRQELTV